MGEGEELKRDKEGQDEDKIKTGQDRNDEEIRTGKWNEKKKKKKEGDSEE